MGKYNVEKRNFADGSSEVMVTSRNFGSDIDEAKESLHKAEKKKQNKKKTRIICFDSEGNVITSAHSKHESLRRAKQNVNYLAKCNKWDLFATLTVSNEVCGIQKGEQPSYEITKEKITKELAYLKKLYPDMEYLVVMEQGAKNGRWHAHALIQCKTMKKDLVDSGKKDKKNNHIYNLKTYRKGFTTFQPVRSMAAVMRYITKYIGKSLGDIPFGQHRFFATRGLDTIADHRVRYLFDDKEEFAALIRQLYETADSVVQSFIAAIDTTIQYFRFNAPALSAGESVATT